MGRYVQVAEWIAEWIRATADPACSRVTVWYQNTEAIGYSLDGSAFRHVDEYVGVTYLRAGEPWNTYRWSWDGTVDSLLDHIDRWETDRDR